MYSLNAEPILVDVGLSNKPADGESTGSSISLSQNYVLFTSEASNLIEGDDNNAVDLFLRDLDSDKITNVNICNKNDFLDVTIWYPYYEDKNFPIRLITNFCDYNKSVVLDTANLKPRNIVSLTCVKRN